MDDTSLCRKFHIHILKDSVAECIEAGDGIEAVNKVKECVEKQIRLDAILMDSSMPRMDGPTAVRIIREMGFKGKIFAITGNAFDSDINEFLEHGADQVLIKPVKAENYSQIIASL